MESCARCGVRQGEHPIVGIMSTKDAETVNAPVIKIGGPNNDWCAVPVCVECHTTPWSKDPLPRIKAAFFARGDMGIALRMANFPAEAGRLGGATVPKGA